MLDAKPKAAALPTLAAFQLRVEQDRIGIAVILSFYQARLFLIFSFVSFGQVRLSSKKVKRSGKANARCKTPSGTTPYPCCFSTQVPTWIGDCCNFIILLGQVIFNIFVQQLQLGQVEFKKGHGNLRNAWFFLPLLGPLE